MKKQYINPTTEIILVATEQMMAGSEVGVAFGKGTKSGSEAASRRNSFWDDEEE